MPTRVLHHTAWALLCFVLTVQSLKCNYCLRENPTQGCDGAMNVCFPIPQQKCIAVTVLYQNKLKYRMEGCTKASTDCTRRRRHPVGYTVTVTCCETDLCNHWDNDH